MSMQHPAQKFSFRYRSKIISTRPQGAGDVSILLKSSSRDARRRAEQNVATSPRQAFAMSNLTAKHLRANQTEAERRLWNLVRNKRLAGTRFRRQQPIGPYYADFFCASAKLIVELDGSQHADEEQSLHDEIRSQWLAERGYRVLRFWNADVLGNPNGVIDAIWNVAIGQSGSLPPAP
jgi:very-short-patch-repair endonuclease